MTYSALMPNPASGREVDRENHDAEPGRSRNELLPDDSGRAQLHVRSINHVDAGLEQRNAIVGILVDSPLPENRLQPATEPGLGDFSPAPKKSPKVGVLIVDDESLIRWSLAETLIDHDYTVMEAGDGKQALAVLENPPEPVEVVMLDYRLPGYERPPAARGHPRALAGQPGRDDDRLRHGGSRRRSHAARGRLRRQQAD